MKKLEKIKIECYKKYFLTSGNHIMLWEGIVPDLNIDSYHHNSEYLFVKILKGTDFAYCYTIENGFVNYHGIGNWFIIDLLTDYKLQEEHKDMLPRINGSFGATLNDAYSNKQNVFG